MSSEDQQQGNRYSPDCSPISRASPHLRVEDMNILDVFAADSNAIHNGSEVKTRFNIDENWSTPHDNHGDVGSDQGSPREASPEFTKSNPALSIENAVDDDNGLYQESENSSQWCHPLQEEVSSSSTMRSLETQVTSESSSEHAEEAQPERSPLAERKPQRFRTPTDEQAKEAQSEPSSLAVRKSKRHRTPTDEQAKEAQPEPSSLTVRKSQRHRTPTKKYDSSVEERKTPRQSRRKKVSTSPDGKSTPTAEEELKLRQLHGWINPMLDQLWQWTTPALNDLENGPKYYKRCFTGTRETPSLSFKLGDAIEFMGMESSKCIGIVAELYQRHRREEDRYRFRYLDQRIHTVWLYTLSDIPEEFAEDASHKLRKKGLNLESAMFISPHSDVNAVQKVLHTVKLLSVEEYSSSTRRRDSNEYYLAGIYDTVWRKLHLKLRGNFSLPEFLHYNSLKQQALMGHSFVITLSTADWDKSND